MPESVLERDLAEILAAPGIPWERLAGRTLLVSGAAGMLPGYMVRAALALNRGPLRAAPLRVLGLVRGLDRARAALGAWAEDPALRLVEHDVRAPFEPGEPVHFVVHGASQASPKRFGPDPAGTIDANTLGTRALLELARAAKAESFLFLSSSEVYGEQPDPGRALAEGDFGRLDPMKVRSCYGEGKRLGEALCAAWHSQFGVPAVVARPFHTYGPTVRLEDGRIYADFLADLLAGRDLALSSDGSARRAFCYISDATAAFFLLLLKGEAGAAYNVGNPDEEHSMLDLARILVGLRPGLGLKATAKPRPEGYLPSAVDRNCPDISRIAALGWRPRVGVAEGFRRMLEHHGSR